MPRAQVCANQATDASKVEGGQVRLLDLLRLLVTSFAGGICLLAGGPSLLAGGSCLLAGGTREVGGGAGGI